MKPTFETISSTYNSSFLVRKFEEICFAAPYHFHPEYELTLILKGCGKRYVGSHMANYFPDDLILLGPNVPHCWKTENSMADENSISVVIQFDADFMGPQFFNKPEMKRILQLLNHSKYGIQFTENISQYKNKINGLLNEKSSFRKLVLLLEILHGLANANKILLDNQNLYAELSVMEKERMNTVIAYVVENFRENISLRKAAAVANMNPHAFCKYFKKVTRKTFIEAVTGYRINFAMQQLVNTDKPIAQVGFDSGFNDISNFYKTFKDRMMISPLSYRNDFAKQEHQNGEALKIETE